MNQDAIAHYARKLYPAFAQYVHRCETAHQGAFLYGLCPFIQSIDGPRLNIPRLAKLLRFYIDEVPNTTPACVELPNSMRHTPFNCACGKCGVPTYTAEGTCVGSGLARINNPYRRAFINWVCRQAGQPELLP